MCGSSRVLHAFASRRAWLGMRSRKASRPDACGPERYFQLSNHILDSSAVLISAIRKRRKETEACSHHRDACASAATVRRRARARRPRTPAGSTNGEAGVRGCAGIRDEWCRGDEEVEQDADEQQCMEQRRQAVQKATREMRMKGASSRRSRGGGAIPSSS